MRCLAHAGPHIPREFLTIGRKCPRTGRVQGCEAQAGLEMGSCSRALFAVCLNEENTSEGWEHKGCSRGEWRSSCSDQNPPSQLQPENVLPREKNLLPATSAINLKQGNQVEDFSLQKCRNLL